MKVKSLSHFRLLVTPWSAAYQASPSMGFSRQEYWSRVPLPSLNSVLRMSKRHFAFSVNFAFLVHWSSHTLRFKKENALAPLAFSDAFVSFLHLPNMSFSDKHFSLIASIGNLDDSLNLFSSIKKRCFVRLKIIIHYKMMTQSCVFTRAVLILVLFIL